MAAATNARDDTGLFAGLLAAALALAMRIIARALPILVSCAVGADAGGRRSWRWRILVQYV